MPNEDSDLQCPYDPHHRIRPERMQVHLGRCRRNHKHLAQTTTTCPFNVTHVVSKREIDLHIATCDSRISFEKYKYREDTATRPTPIPPQPVLRLIETSENWDDEPDVPTYNPLIYAASANILRELKGESPSLKKYFRATEHIRLNNLRNGFGDVEKAKTTAGATTKSKPAAEVKAGVKSKNNIKTKKPTARLLDY